MSHPLFLSRLKHSLTTELNLRGIHVTWVPENSGVKFYYNTNIRHEDEFGRGLNLKSSEELCDEILRCGKLSLKLMFHEVVHKMLPNIIMLYYTPD